MVAVVHAAPRTSAPEAIAAWLAGLAATYPPDDIAALGAALDYARERCGATIGRDGEPLLERAIGTATILAGLRLDAGAVRAALLIGLPGAGAFDPETVAGKFGADVAALVGGVARMEDIRALPATGSAEDRAAQAERLRKMLLAMVEDIRVVLIRLAEPHADAAVRHARGDEARDRASAPRARRSTSTRRSPTGSASGS